jgi:hypothetical protein
MSFSPPSESYGTTPTTRRFRRVVPSVRFPASSRHPCRGSARHGGFHATAAFRPRVFATPRRLAPHVTLRAYCIPQARPGFSLQGLSLARSRLGSSPLPCPLVVTAGTPPLAKRPSRSPTSGPCSPGESVAAGPRLSEPTTRSPLGLSLPQGLPHSGRRSRFHDPPLTSLLCSRTGRERKRSPGSSRAEVMGQLSRVVPSLSKFLAFSITRSFSFANGPGLSFRLRRAASLPPRACSLFGPPSLPTAAVRVMRVRPYLF